MSVKKKKAAPRAAENELLDDLRGRVTRLRKEIAEFETRHPDPFDRLNWIGAVIEPASGIRVFSEVIDALEGGITTVENVNLYAQGRIGLMSRNGAIKSTAPLENMLYAEQLRMWCEVYDVAGEYSK